MRMRRRSVASQFKQDAVAVVRWNGRSANQIARSRSLNETLLEERNYRCYLSPQIR
ncbi:MAG: hypothetical protein ABIU05_06820 [Nitrospirales bacterium]